MWKTIVTIVHRSYYLKCVIYKIAIWLISAIVFIGTLEGIARIEDKIKWGADIASNYSSDELRTTDQLGVHNKFNAKFEKWTINSAGFRGPEIEINKANGLKRIIFLGASETFGLYESKEMEFPAQVRAMLDKKKTGQYQVINAATVGRNIPQTTQFYSSWLLKFNPDIVVYYPSPAGYLDEKPPIPVKLNIQFNKKNYFQFRLSKKALIIVKKHIPESIQSYVKQYMISRAVRKHGVGWVWNSPPPERLAMFRAHLLNFIEEVRRNGANPVLMTHSHRFPKVLSLEEKYQLISWRKFYPRATENCLLEMENAANTIIREIGSDYGVTIIDLEKTIPKNPKYFADFVHFTDSGAQIVAQKIEEVLMRLE